MAEEKAESEQPEYVPQEGQNGAPIERASPYAAIRNFSPIKRKLMHL